MATTDKGQQIMDGLLLSQYTESANLRAYFMSFIGEMDYLFEQIEEVYLGRLLETAIGKQLDIIGEILDQNRSVDLGTIYFGFDGAPFAGGFGDETNPLLGGIFQTEDLIGATITPLSDTTYRRVLKCKGALLNSDTISIEDIYRCVEILLNRVPVKAIVTEPANLQVNLELATSDTRLDEQLLVLYMANKYFIPAGTTFTVTLT